MIKNGNNSDVTFLQLGYEGGISLQISFAILAGATFFYFLNTFVFLPKSYIPWPLPLDYEGEGGSIDSAEKNEKGKEIACEKKAVENENTEGSELMLSMCIYVLNIITFDIRTACKISSWPLLNFRKATDVVSLISQSHHGHVTPCQPH